MALILVYNLKDFVLKFSKINIKKEVLTLKLEDFKRNFT
jgi:hypothetical protein